MNAQGGGDASGGGGAAQARTGTARLTLVVHDGSLGETGFGFDDGGEMECFSAALLRKFREWWRGKAHNSQS